MQNNAPAIILHIEDDPAHRLLVSKTLTSHGLTNSLMEAKDGQDGLDYLYGAGKYADREACQLPQLILLDINMPRVDGFEVLRKIKNDPDLKAIPVIMLSTSARDEEIARGYELGADAYLTKPINFGDFVAKLADLQLFEILRQSSAMAQVTEPGRNESGLTILVVEDEPSIALLERKALEKQGHKVIIVGTGTEALDTLHSGSVDITLLDNQLPDMTGMETLCAIRDRFPDMPVVMITGNEGAALATKVMKAGASDYVVKDFESNYLRHLSKIVANNWKNSLLVAERKKVEEALIESEQRFKQLSEEQDILLENAGDFIYRRDVDGIFSYISKSVKNVTGYAVEDWLEHCSEYITDSAINEDAPQNSEKAIRTGKRQPPYLVEILHKEGAKIILEVDEGPIVENGTTIGIIGSARDVTARKKAMDALAQSEEKQRLLLESTDVVAWEYDWHAQRFTYVSESAVKKYGYALSEWAEAGFWADHIYHEDRGMTIKYCVYCTEKGQNHDFEYRFIHADGHCVWVRDIVSVEIKDDHPLLLRGFLIDIDVRKQMEEELRKAKEEAEKATKLKDKFVSLVAHDIRAPFGSLVSFLQLLENDPDVVLSSQQKSLLESLLKSGEQQLKMIKELLDISRLQTGNIILKPQFYDGYNIAVNAIGYISHIAYKKHIALKNSVPVGSRLYCDPDLYSEVMINLANNAVKFCKEGDTIEFLLSDKGDSGLGVCDTGAGVPPDFLPNLFRHDIKTTSPGSLGEIGTGLGLPYCDDIMKAHGGKLVVESIQGKGAFFSAILPPVTPIILVVDDDASLLNVIGLLLEDVGATILEASDGKEATSIITKNRPHVIVSDLHMPNMGGFDLLKWVRSNSALKHTPFIVLTSDNDIGLRDQAFRMGADDFLTKPFPKQEFIPRVRRFLI